MNQNKNPHFSQNRVSRVSLPSQLYNFGLKGGMENGNNTRHFGTSMDRTNNTDAGVELNLVSLNN